MGETYGAALKDVYGESVGLTTTAAHVLFRPNYHEVLAYCASDWRWGLAPKLSKVVYYSAAGGTYTDYTNEAIDRDSTTHVPLDAMATGDYLYLRTEGATRGFYFTIDGTNKNDNVATLDWEYLYDVADTKYQDITGTVSGAFTVGESVLGGTSAATGTLVYGPAGSTYITVKNVTGEFAVGETVTGVTSTETCSTVTAVGGATYGTGYFTDVASDSDGTNSVADTLKQSGLYSFTLPSVIWGELPSIGGGGYWYRFAPSATLSATVDIVDIIPACKDTNYGYGFGGLAKNFSINTRLCGAFEFDHASSGTLYIDWLRR